jgi:hypothetical protein
VTVLASPHTDTASSDQAVRHASCSDRRDTPFLNHQCLRPARRHRPDPPRSVIGVVQVRCRFNKYRAELREEGEDALLKLGATPEEVAYLMRRRPSS